jgi:alpha-D-ribose 1-methylphosphonate 5-triphosphate synthase subunit PhnG
MAWPTVVVDTTHLDSATDSPGNARADIKQMADNVNAIKDSRNAASGIAPLDASGLLPTANLPTVPANKGGTGQAGFVVGDILVANSTTTLSKLSPGANGTVLKSNGPGALPSYGAVSAPVASQAEAEAGTDNTKMMTPLRTKEAISALSLPVGVNFLLYTASGSFTVPEGVDQIYVAVWGGGGGAIKRTTSGNFAEGREGGYGSAFITNLSEGSSIAITIGEGGGTLSSNNGTAPAGQASSFGSFITATGGQGGQSGTDPSPRSPGTSVLAVTDGLSLVEGTSGTTGINGFIGFTSVKRPIGAGSSPIAWDASLKIQPGSSGGSAGSTQGSASAGVNGAVLIIY